MYARIGNYFSKKPIKYFNYGNKYMVILYLFLQGKFRIILKIFYKYSPLSQCNSIPRSRTNSVNS